MAQTPLWLSTFLILASPFIGSFLGAAVARLPAGESVIVGRSKCDGCGRQLSPIDLIPVLGRVLQRGRCKACGVAIDPAYPLIEIAALFIAILAVAIGSGWAVLWGCLLGWSMLTLAVIDWRHFLLPDAINLPLIPIGLAIAFIPGGIEPIDAAIGALVGGGVLWAVRATYQLLRGREGLGLGDIKLFAAAGAWLGWANLPMVLLAASIGALIIVAGLAVTGREMKADTAMPFGTPLAAAIFVVWIAAEALS